MTHISVPRSRGYDTLGHATAPALSIWCAPPLSPLGGGRRDRLGAQPHLRAHRAEARGGVGKQLVGRAVLDHGAVFEREDPIEAAEVLKPVADHEERLRQAEQHAMHLPIEREVHVGGRLIAEQQLQRAAPARREEGAAEGEQLPLALAKLRAEGWMAGGRQGGVKA